MRVGDVDVRGGGDLRMSSRRRRWGQRRRVGSDAAGPATLPTLEAPVTGLRPWGARLRGVERVRLLTRLGKALLMVLLRLPRRLSWERSEYSGPGAGNDSEPFGLSKRRQPRHCRRVGLKQETHRAPWSDEALFCRRLGSSDRPRGRPRLRGRSGVPEKRHRLEGAVRGM